MVPGDAAVMKPSVADVAGDRRRQVGDVRVQRLPGSTDSIGPVADRPQVHGRGAGGGEPVAELGEVVQVFRRLARDVAGDEAAEPVPDVGAVADLAHLAVVDDVDAGLDLVAHRLVDAARR